MTDDARHCERDGYFEGESCPVCGERGRTVVDGSRRRRLSKFLSGALRHFPDDAGITLNEAGWTPFATLVAAAKDKYEWAGREMVTAVVETDPKGRFEWDQPVGTDQRWIRAAYGHSVDVLIGENDGPVPETLYHGTAPRNLDSIFESGLQPMNRQRVHLSASVADARAVGDRHADEPVVLVVDAGAMRDDGIQIAQRAPSVYTTRHVPPQYLSRRGR